MTVVTGHDVGPDGRNRTARCSVTSDGGQWLVRLAVLVITIHGMMLAWISLVTSPNIDELAHLPAGISHWEFGRFELYRVNPPLVRMVSAIPVVLSDPKTDWSAWNNSSPFARSEFWVGKDFTRNNADRLFWYYTLARWACIPFCLIGPWICFLGRLCVLAMATFPWLGQCASCWRNVGTRGADENYVDRIVPAVALNLVHLASSVFETRPRRF